MKKYILLVITLFCWFNLFSQNYTISGVLTDSITGEKLISATIYEANSKKGTVTNYSGFYSLTIPKGNVNLQFAFIGFISQISNFELNNDTIINLKLNETLNLINEIVIFSDNSENFIKKADLGLVELSPKQIKSLPVFLGEKDMLKTLQFTPGVQFGNEGSAGLYVRGGSQEHNLILIDGVTVYSINHLLGFFSVINSDAVNEMKLYKGSIPAKYNGRISSVLDVYLRDGNINKFRTAISIGLLSSSILLEGPIVKNKSSFIITARRTYFDLLARPFIKSFADQAVVGYNFYDVTAKLNFKISEKTKLYFSIFNGNDNGFSKSDRDYFSEQTNIETNIKNNVFLKWGNTTSAFRINKILTKKLYSNIMLSYSQFKFSNGESYSETSMVEPDTLSESFSYNYNSFIKDLGLKAYFDFYPNSSNNIDFGISSIYHNFNPGVSVNKFSDINTTNNIDTIIDNSQLQSLEFSVFINDDIKISNKFKTNIGLNINAFKASQKYYPSIEPRISLNYIATDNFSIKLSYSKLSQFVHLLSNSSLSFPTDLWVPVTDKIKPSTCDQYTAGFYFTSKSDFEISVEGYYKTMNNLLEYKEGSSFFDVKTGWEDKVETGKGWAYGTELFIRKNFDKITFWANYTLSWSWRQFENISFGQKFPFKYDKRHNLSLAIVYKPKSNIDIGATWIMCSGMWVTLPEQSIYSYPSQVNFNYYNGMYYPVEYYSQRNNYRLPLYHRLDISVNFTKEKKNRTRIWSLGVYNAYNRLNAFYIEKSNNGYDKVCIFPVMPFVSYSLKF